MAKNRDRQPGTYSIHEAKTQLSRLLDQVLATGQPIHIGRRGKAEVMLAPMPGPALASRAPGLFRSTIRLLETLPPSPVVPADTKGLLVSAQSLVRWFAAPYELNAQTHQILADGQLPVTVSVNALRQVLEWHRDARIELGGLKGRLASACTSVNMTVLPLEPQVLEKAAAMDGDVEAALALLNDLDQA